MRDSKTTPNTPTYCRQKRPTGSDLAFVDLNGQRHYLGVYDTSESREKYHRLLAEWTACNGFLKPKAEELTVNELCARFLLHARIYYRRPDGTPSPEAKNFDPIFRLLRQLYGGEKASVFGPTALKAVREKMIDLDWSRYHVNKQVGRLKMIFKWGVSEEIVPPSVHQALLTVDGLKRGRCLARESEAIKPVPETHVEAVRPHICDQVWAVMQLQLLTGARSGELVILRACDLDRTQPVWIYHPPTHKTAYHGHERSIYVGSKAQEVLLPFLEGREVTDYVFRPSEAEQARLARRHAKRVTPMSCGNVPKDNANQDRLRAPGDHYTQASYRRAIDRACKKAGVPSWHPHQLRHNAGTRFRHQFGLEAAQVLLGHRKADITQIYAETNTAKAIQIVEKIG